MLVNQVCSQIAVDMLKYVRFLFFYQLLIIIISKLCDIILYNARHSIVYNPKTATKSHFLSHVSILITLFGH